MGLKTRASENTGGLAELLDDPRDREGIMSSGHKRMGLGTAVAYVLDVPSMAPALDEASATDGIDYQAVAQMLEERLSTIAKEVAEQEQAPVPVAPSPVQPPASQQQHQQQQQQQQQQHKASTPQKPPPQ